LIELFRRGHVYTLVDFTIARALRREKRIARQRFIAICVP
jgi:hypothetical protein